jgi:hypothetical protein
VSKTNYFHLNDANCYRRLSRALARWVAATMSPNNPARHVPTDAEIQHQARWIFYDEDDPWDYTPAENEEWLKEFKRANGILQDGGPVPAEAGPCQLGSKNACQREEEEDVMGFINEHISDEDMGNIVQDMDFSMSGQQEHDGGVQLSME